MSRFILICSLAATLAASATPSADAAESAEKSAWVRDSLACADLGIDPGSRSSASVSPICTIPFGRCRIRILLTNPGCGLVSFLRVSCPQTAHDIPAAISQGD